MIMNNLKNIREIKGMSQLGLAIKVGKTASWIAMMERMPNVRIKEFVKTRLSLALNVSVKILFDDSSYLLTLENNKKLYTAIDYSGNLLLLSDNEYVNGILREKIVEAEQELNAENQTQTPDS